MRSEFRFLDRYWSRTTTFLLLVEYALFVGSAAFSWRLRYPLKSAEELFSGDVWLRAMVFAATLTASLYMNGLYDVSEYLAPRRLSIRFLRAWTFAALALWAIYYVIPQLFMGRGVLAISFTVSAASVVGCRALLPWVLKKRMLHERILIVGADESAQSIGREIVSRDREGYRLIGFVDNDPELQGVSIVNPSVLGTVDQVFDLALAHQATRVVVAQKDNRGKLSLEALMACKTKGIPVEMGSDYRERLTGRIWLDEPRIKSWLVFSEGFLVSPSVLFMKRIGDMLLAALGIMLAAPVMALSAIAVKISSPGPVVFRQERVGKDGKLFDLLKFRSMVKEAETDGTAQWALEQDPRITRVGRILRRFRLDELPQLWNVLVGDMSLVGPRPEREEFVRELVQLNSLFSQRLAVRPGITGWAQIKAPYAATFEQSLIKLEYDLFYLKNLFLP